jgi:hypothetical protein
MAIHKKAEKWSVMYYACEKKSVTLKEGYTLNTFVDKED